MNRLFLLARREILRAGPQAVLFVLSTTLALVTLVSVGGFSRTVQDSFLRDARELHAGDVILHSHREFSEGLLRAVRAEVASGRAEAARLYEFYSMARTSDNDRLVLSSILVAPDNYPFYGTVTVGSGRPFQSVHEVGGVVVEPSLLDQLGVRVGDTIQLGSAALTIRDTLIREPDRPLNAFSLGPRIIVHAYDLEALQLVRTGSRVEHRLLLKALHGERVDPMAARLRVHARKDEEWVETFRTARSGIKRFLDNFLFFLSLIGVFTLILAGFGIQSSLTALLREKRDTLAVMRALGATSGYVARLAAIIVCILAAAGTALGILCGAWVQRLLPVLMRDIVPGLSGGLSPGAVLEGCLMGAVVTAVFTSIPLRRLREVRPVSVLGHEVLPETGRTPLVVHGALVTVLAVLLVLWKIEDTRTGLWFVAGVGGLILLSAGAGVLVLWISRTRRPDRLLSRLVLRGLERPGSGTLVTLTTLVTALTVILSIRLLELNLFQNFVGSYPAEAPNVYFLDIQPSQRDEARRILEASAEFHPVVRARVTAVSGTPIDREVERQSRRDNLAREFNLTYYDTLLGDERLVAGKSLFDPKVHGPQVSVLTEVLEMRSLEIGDTITFTIAGVPLEARITSFRERVHSSVRPFFYFVFPPEVLEDAPQTFFAAVRVAPGQLPALQSRMVSSFPNVSVIDVMETVNVFAGVMRRLSVIVRFFGWFSIAAGLLIVTSAVLATRHVRLRESVYYRILGAKSRFVLRVFAAEHVLLGTLAGGLAFVFSEMSVWILCRQAFRIDFHAFPGTLGALASAVALLVLATGVAGTVPALRKKPVVYLREVAPE